MQCRSRDDISAPATPPCDYTQPRTLRCNVSCPKRSNKRMLSIPQTPPSLRRMDCHCKTSHHPLPATWCDPAMLCTCLAGTSAVVQHCTLHASVQPLEHSNLKQSSCWPAAPLKPLQERTRFAIPCKPAVTESLRTHQLTQPSSCTLPAQHRRQQHVAALLRTHGAVLAAPATLFELH